MANDFFDKYKAKASEDLGDLPQQPVPSAPIAPTAPVAPAKPQAQNPTPSVAKEPSAPAAPVAASTPAPAPKQEGGLRFEQDASNGFIAPKRAAAPAASHAATGTAFAKSKNKTVFGVPVLYIGAAVAAVLIILFMFLFLGRGKELPAMSGWSGSEAELWAGENKVNLRVEEVYSDEVASGNILDQSPAAGERVEKGEFLTVTRSKGPDPSVMVMVPDIMNMTMAEVEAWADDNFMTTVRITTQTSDTVASGKVISFTVNDNTVLQNEIRRDTPFYVIFSKGQSAGEAVKVPNFLTMSVIEAEAFAEENKLVLVKEEEFSETVAKGNVIRQDVKAEESVYSGATITLTISKGEEIIMPNFYSLSREMAAAKASQLGIQTIVREQYSSVAKDKLISQSMKVGTLYQDTDIVELVYSLGNSYLYTSFLGQNISDVYSWRDEMNEQGASIEVLVQYTANSAAYGTIVDQSHINTSIAMDETIFLVASAGQPVVVPSFVQKAGQKYADIITKADVVETCNTLGIVPIFIEEYASGRLYSEAWEQSIAAGTEMKQGDTIIIKVVPACIGTTTQVPNFVGKTVEQTEKDARKFAIYYQDEAGTALAAMDVEKGATVKSQSAVAGTHVADGFAVTLTMQVAAAPEPIPTAVPTYEVPNFVGLSYKEVLVANAEADSEKFDVRYEDSTGKAVTKESASTELKGKVVISQSVSAYGQEVQNALIVLTFETPESEPTPTVEPDETPTP